MVNKINCPVCNSHLITPFLYRKNVPVHQNLVIKSEADAIKINRGDLNILVCEECGFIFNQSFKISNLSYGEDYDNTQACSPSFNEYLDNLARYLIFEKGVQNSSIVEVGCGKGLFLRKLVEQEGTNNSGYGFDPSYVGLSSELSGRLKFEKRYYGADCAKINADVVICRHVIEHIPEPLILLDAIRQALLNSPDARVFFETPCVEWILQNQVIWDFFYEHCSYFTADSLTTAFEASGFSVESVNHVFGGQYLWLEATINNKKSVITKKPGSIPHVAKNFATAESNFNSFWSEKIKSFATKGRIAIWGAGAKGVTFANLIDPECKWIACVVDLNPQKQGCYLPGTGHQIVSYKDMKRYNIKTAILMNPNYREENIALLEKTDLDVELIDA